MALDSSQQETISTFVAMTNADSDTAKAFLKAASWNMGTALDRFYAFGGDASKLAPPSNSRRSPSVNAQQRQPGLMSATAYLISSALGNFFGQRQVPPQQQQASVNNNNYNVNMNNIPSPSSLPQQQQPQNNNPSNIKKNLRRRKVAKVNDADFPSTLTFQQCDALQIGDNIDCRDEVGRFLLAVIVDKNQYKLKIHFEGWNSKWNIWCNYKNQPYRFAAARSISRKPNTRYRHLKIKDYVDINPIHKHEGWRVGQIRRMDKYSGQAQIVYKENGKEELYWTHLNNPKEIAPFWTRAAEATAKPKPPQSIPPKSIPPQAIPPPPPLLNDSKEQDNDNAQVYQSEKQNINKKIEPISEDKKLLKIKNDEINELKERVNRLKQEKEEYVAANYRQRSKILSLEKENGRLREERDELMDDEKGLKFENEELKKEIKRLRMQSINVKDYKSWSNEQILMWIMSIENGRFSKYKDVLAHSLSEEDVNGGNLDKVNEIDIKGWGNILLQVVYLTSFVVGVFLLQSVKRGCSSSLS